MDDVLVSIYCLTYNHELYIRDALEGFVNQKCDFKFEVIIHDDASTDKTTEIIREYEKKYPDIIKTIYQKENQTRKGINKIKEYIYPRLQGKYIAVCEGDDYWIDSYKLQKEVLYLEGHPQCTFCFTNGIISNMESMEKRRFIPYGNDEIEMGKCDFSLHDFYELSFIPTASFMFPKRCFDNIMPYYGIPCPVGDLKLRLFLTAQGYAHFIDEDTCVYRESVPGSSMTTWKRQTRKEKYQRAEKIMEMLALLDEVTNEEFTDGLIPFMEVHGEGMLGLASSFSVFKNKYCKLIFKRMSLQKRILVLLKILIPERIKEHILNK